MLEQKSNLTGKKKKKGQLVNEYWYVKLPRELNAYQIPVNSLSLYVLNKHNFSPQGYF